MVHQSINDPGKGPWHQGSFRKRTKARQTGGPSRFFNAQTLGIMPLRASAVPSVLVLRRVPSWAG